MSVGNLPSGVQRIFTGNLIVDLVDLTFFKDQISNLVDPTRSENLIVNLVEPHPQNPVVKGPNVVRDGVSR